MAQWTLLARPPNPPQTGNCLVDSSQRGMLTSNLWISAQTILSCPLRRFLEDCYLLPDPNAVRVHPLNLGSHCSLCDHVVCVGEACSIFYAKRFCARCAQGMWPLMGLVVTSDPGVTRV